MKNIVHPSILITFNCALVATLAAPLRGDAPLAVLPATIQLAGPASQQQLVVERVAGNQYVGDVTREVTLASSDPGVVRIEENVAIPVGNGMATITASVGDQQAAAQVEVVHMDQAHEWGFRNHVQSVVAKMGCNSGSCHGALAGKGGLKLSLRGYDTLRDYMTITRQARGRRIELADPGRSLILAKPTGALPHKGGVRFPVESREYQVISQWITGGVKPPRDDDPRLTRLEILPAAATLKPSDEQQLLVRALFTDGHQEDVTQWAKFASTNETVAKVDQQGKVSVVGHGDGAVTAWYLNQIVITRVTSPYDHQNLDAAFAAAERRNFIDELVIDKLADLKLAPSPPASEAEFLRRATLDTIGKLPTADEARHFLADTAPDKRHRLVDALLARSEFVDYWSYKWSDLLLVTGSRLRPQAVKAYYDWIRQGVAVNKPWDVFVREVLTSSGSSYEQGATNFFALHQDPQEMAENTSVAFLGLNINCARCHNHPLEKWTNDQYYAMANLFARVRAKGWGGDVRSGDGLRTVFEVEGGDLIQPLTGKAQPPTPLDGEPIPHDSTMDRRAYLVHWLASPENRYFSRAITNRVWANFFGVGLVERVDDLRVSNPPSNEALLSAAAQFLVEHEFDLKQLMRAILHSATYQRSSRALPENQDDTRFYARYYPRRLMAEVLLDAISDVTGVPDEFTELDLGGAGAKEKTTAYPKGTRALQLGDSAVASYFLATFGRNERKITCECERSNEPSMVQVLHIANGNTINQKLAAEKGRISSLLAAATPVETIIEEAYLNALSRYPTADEKTQLAEILSQQASENDQRQRIEDLYWGILSSREFLFNH